MAYVIAEPCIGTKDTACVDACPVDCIHPKKDEADFDSATQLYIRSNVSTAARACQCVQSQRSLHWMTCPRSGQTSQR